MNSCGLVCNKKCPYEGNDLTWVLRRGGCPVAYIPPVAITANKERVGQQKGKGKKSKKVGKWKTYNNNKTTKRWGTLTDRLASHKQGK